MKKIWDNISFLGLEDKNREDAFLFFRDIILLNRLVTVLVILFIIYLPVEVIFNGIDLVFIIISQIFIVGLTLLLNKYKKFDIARWYFFIIAILVTAPILYVTPREASNHLFLIPVSLIPVIMFRENWKIICGFAFVFTLFYVVAFTRDEIADIIDVPLETLHFFSYIFNAMLFMILFMLMLYFKMINRDYESVMIKKTQELKLSNEIIEQRNKDITDSINYALRIQTAILPPQHFIDKFLKDFFILYKPKDIVAGDFYWAEHVGNHFFIAVADCTGHGVPGAMVSVVCSNALNRAVKEFELTDPGKILDKTRELVIETFAKSNEEVKDGMDISLLAFEISTSSIAWSGANNALYYLENSQLKEIKPDKQPIGITEVPKPFTTHTLPRSISALFLITDGFADQFGGEKGKKFKYANLQKLLLSNAHAKPETQSARLHEAFETWKGDLEQVDDVCVIGIKVG